MLADVAIADGAEQCVGECVQAHVGVGMSLQRVGVSDPDATQPEAVAGREAMHIEARAGTNVGHLSALGQGQVLRCRDLDVAYAAGNHSDAEAMPFGHRRIIGKVAPPGDLGRAMCGEDDGEMKSLGCLSMPEICPLDVARNQSGAVCALQGVGDGERGNGSLMRVEGGQDVVQQTRFHEWPRGIMDQNPVWSAGGQRLQAIEHRPLPRRAAGAGRQQLANATRGPVRRSVRRRLDG